MSASSQTTTNTVIAEDEPLYTIRIAFRGSNLHGRTLYDVDGVPLQFFDGTNLHIFNPSMKEAFDSGDLRLIHKVDPGYRYFITSTEQLHRFRRDMELKCSEEKNRTYHVYDDEDCNYGSKHFKSFILSFY